MNFKWKYAAVLSLVSLIPWSGSAQMEKISDAVYRESLKAYPVQTEAAKNPYLKNYLKALKAEKSGEMAFVTAVRVATDLNGKPEFNGKVAHYAVPPMSELMRLQDTYPHDGKALAPVRILSARDEYEPGSFLVYPLEDLGKVEFKLSAFKDDKGTVFPADKLDLKVIKIWYQKLWRLLWLLLSRQSRYGRKTDERSAIFKWSSVAISRSAMASNILFASAAQPFTEFF